MIITSSPVVPRQAHTQCRMLALPSLSCKLPFSPSRPISHILPLDFRLADPIFAILLPSLRIDAWPVLFSPLREQPLASRTPSIRQGRTKESDPFPYAARGSVGCRRPIRAAPRCSRLSNWEDRQEQRRPQPARRELVDGGSLKCTRRPRPKSSTAGWAPGAVQPSYRYPQHREVFWADTCRREPKLSPPSHAKLLAPDQVRRQVAIISSTGRASLAEPRSAPGCQWKKAIGPHQQGEGGISTSLTGQTLPLLTRRASPLLPPAQDLAHDRPLPDPLDAALLPQSLLAA
ncbi:hypothetical protein N658DRAFT_35897 [Parathielavia hyrcaniae]|uniref:Uncharacterized protein n=1 Tax=Parathielavia hyrcaniae TaxID=113614 RepID=A0AAN6QB45_9PEZI|nr:hypothetical protein N658DRAFT_35897 [Parathielavia hyrcaniae]